MRARLDIPAGTLHRISHRSEILGRNRLGDSETREIVVYTPHGHDGSDLPLLVDIVGFTAGGPSHVNWKNFGEKRSGTPRPPHPRRRIAAGRRRLSGLFHTPRRQPVYRQPRHGALGGHG
ncbi:hypothetical protein QW131_08670 [Roseibium salinum]|nr:hypothetical protein [Roseibium salinum]